MGYEWRRRDDGTSLSLGMYTRAAIEARAEAIRRTRRVVARAGEAAVLDGWIYTVVENYFPGYCREIEAMEPDAVAALPALVRAAGTEEELIRNPRIAPGSAVLAVLARRGQMDLVTRLAAAGWAATDRHWLRGAPGWEALRADAAAPGPKAAAFAIETALPGVETASPGLETASPGVETALRGLEACFSGRVPDPQRVSVQLTSCQWTPDAGLHIAGRVPFVAGFAPGSARLEAGLRVRKAPALGEAVVTAEAVWRDLRPDEQPTADTWPSTLRAAGQLTGFDVEFTASQLAVLAANPNHRFCLRWTLDVAPGAAGEVPETAAFGYGPVPEGFRAVTHTVGRPAGHYPPEPERHLALADGPDLVWRLKDRHWLEVLTRPAPS
jgi:hypothetical protein